MKKQIAAVLLSFIAIMLLFPSTVKADSGPKPSVRITFEHMGDEVCYGTLLSKEQISGPASAYQVVDMEADYSYDLNHDIWEAFVNYKDSDGYYYLQRGWLCSESKKLDWDYYPPQSFKILLYYPKTNTFVVSDTYERYAFDSYFTVNMKGLHIGTVETQTPVLVAERSYDYKGEAISFVCRMIFTILLELGIALLFGFIEKKLLLWIAGINVVTQILLNVMLNLINYNQQNSMFVFIYIVLEVMVIVIEAFLYNRIINRRGQEILPTQACVIYSLVANIASFIAGLFLANWLPGMF